ncbi:MAG: zinc-dependent metalloprotease, partial [Gemmataceae bacterium]|nr:zinc-dependent metalloprotease [Gemmataceae bacterium]
MVRARWLIAPALTALLAGLPLAHAQDGPKDKSDTPTKKGPPAGVPKAGDLKKYDDVVTKEFTTQPGVFAVHRNGDKMYFEVPADQFGKLMLWRAEVAKGPGGESWGGNELAARVLKLERRGNKVYVWKVGFRKRSDGKAVQTAVEAASTDTIIAVFNVECEGKDRSAVINVSDLYVTGLPDLPVSDASGSAGSVDPTRSYVSEVKAFPTNIEVRAMLTFRVGGGGGSPRVGPPSLGGPSGPSATALVHYSLVALPETPMVGRFFDPRVGYFTERFEDYSSPRGWAQTRQYITRFRLEKKDPSAAVSEPVKPITFYLANEIPEKWRPFMKKGVEDWNAAFEKAGFKNAVVCKDAPTRTEDPNFDPEDARYSVIRWVAEPTMNAMGPNVHDPRSGEVISAHIIFWHDVVKLAQMWYFVQCSAVDERARKLPLPDDLTGELLRYVCCHEVGHTLGLRHNHRASQAYSISQLRDPAFCEKNGSVASIMSYGRFNYVCQPEDRVKCLIPKLAPYDHFAIEWGYKPLGAKAAADEKKALDELAAKQIDEPFLRFGGEDGPSGVDPTVLTENIGSDPVEATALGLKNLDRVTDFLLAATTEKGEDYALLRETYQQVVSHRARWFGAVVKQVGGVVEYRTLAGRGDVTFVRVPKDKQKGAVKFLLDNAFTTPTKLLNPKVVNQFKYSGVANDIASQQQSLLGQLLDSGRLNRLFDAELQDGDKAYTAVELLGDVQDGLFSETKADAPKVDPLRRQLQRAYVDVLRREFEPAGPAVAPRFGRGDDGPVGPPVSELRGVARAALRKLEKQ